MDPNLLAIQPATTADLPTIRAIHQAAFDQVEEADLVEDLLHDATAEPVVSLLAIEGDHTIGHILFTRMYLDESPEPILLHILAPLAVLPEYQGKGVGGKLIRAGLDHLRELGSQGAFVFGHTTYYPRYGFQPDAARLGFKPPYDIPEEHADAWMVQFFTNEAQGLPHGRVRCAAMLDDPKYWRD